MLDLQGNNDANNEGTIARLVRFCKHHFDVVLYLAKYATV